MRANLKLLPSRARALAHGDPFQVSRAQDFQVLLFFQGLTLGNTTSSGTQVLSLHPDRSGFLSSSFCTSQVGVTVLEAQKLVGVNINPYVAVQVGGQRRVTATQRGTNCPFYNEVGATTEEGEPERMGGVHVRTIPGGGAA